MKASFLTLFIFIFLALNANAAIGVKSSLPWMKSLGATAECVINNADFQKEVSAIEKFDYSTRKGKQVVADLAAMKGVEISTYKTKNPFSKTIAYTYGGAKTIYFNTRKNPRDFKEMVNTVVHEASHIVGYGHGNNSSVGKQKSVPYWVGAIAEKYVLHCSKGFGI
jgi:hypothetical protein